MAKMREGPAKNAVKQKALRVLKQRKMYAFLSLLQIVGYVATISKNLGMNSRLEILDSSLLIWSKLTMPHKHWKILRPL